MTSEKQQCLALAESLKVEVEITGGRDFALEAWAPEGQIFVCNSAHCLVCATCDAEPARVAWRDMRDRLRYGLEPDPDADFWDREGR